MSLLTSRPLGGLAVLALLISSGLLAGCSSVSESGAAGEAGSGLTAGETTEGEDDDGWETGEEDEGSTAGDEGTGTGGIKTDMPGEPPGPCDPWMQDCPEEEKCAYYQDPYGEVATRCVPLVAFPREAGEPCKAEPGHTGLDDCDLGSVCAFLDGEGNGVCTAMCGGSPEQPVCDQGSTCQLCADGQCPSLCLSKCNPLEPNCPEPLVCGPGESGFVCGMDASPSDQGGGQGEPCEFLNECNPGSTCIEASYMPSCQDGFCCAAYCNVGDPESCEPGLECLPYSAVDEGLGPDYPSLGVCVG